MNLGFLYHNLFSPQRQPFLLEEENNYFAFVELINR